MSRGMYRCFEGVVAVGLGATRLSAAYDQSEDCQSLQTGIHELCRACSAKHSEVHSNLKAEPHYCLASHSSKDRGLRCVGVLG